MIGYGTFDVYKCLNTHYLFTIVFHWLMTFKFVLSDLNSEEPKPFTLIINFQVNALWDTASFVRFAVYACVTVGRYWPYNIVKTKDMWSFFLLTCCCQLCFSLVRCTLYQSKQLLGTFSCSRGPKVKFTFVKCSSNCTEFPLLILVKFHLATCIHLGKLDLGPGCPSLLLRDSLCQQEDIHHAQAFCH